MSEEFSVFKHKLKTATTLPRMIYDRHVCLIHAEREKTDRGKKGRIKMNYEINAAFLRFYEQA